ncbi:DUF7673 family protein [Acinetobacter beijerinckii]|uniref:DUF7673 domain-containing protein n=1 Tax=Acinetobacter beijerinckii CIP 110307 TaxID=1217648 RepID=N9F6G8_9GAMM|nr:hypothetical protein [Acinetobacter beijerinckii]ENW02915.1 hypothetical protein F933_03321 [Acinetobacter beijerinckii CIP 110307]
MTYPVPKLFEPTQKEKDEMMNNLLTSLEADGAFSTKAHEQGEPALFRLINIADSDSGQSITVRKFLLGCYNGARFPFDLTDLRSLDTAIVQDCLSVLAMDSRLTQEVHRYIENGSQIFEGWAQTVWSRGQLETKAKMEGMVEVLDYFIFGNDLKTTMSHVYTEEFEEHLAMLDRTGDSVRRWIKNNLD